MACMEHVAKCSTSRFLCQHGVRIIGTSHELQRLLTGAGMVQYDDGTMRHNAGMVVAYCNNLSACKGACSTKLVW